MKLADLQLEDKTVSIGHLVLTSGGRRQEFVDVTAAFAAGFIYVERFLAGRIVVSAYPAATVEVAEDISAGGPLTW
ncbi:hypothetical protein [Blastococcus sp. TF02A-26]|uniref:hypothetical protein n=1 Tax=Blastococcus sp. TF02A-26 TaxID=2250577 RepID=UPI000DE83B57|nr:hypothetical protein [Blastococcus sp. TF02A-26]RBY88382.1 hypothetical protein DQ240_06070 [Blastococcus sp. TF02A-26]